MSGGQNLDQAIPSVCLSVSRIELISPDMPRRIATMLGHAPRDWPMGATIPFGWHFPLLGADTRHGVLRADGFPGLGIPLPALPGRRLVATGRTVDSFGTMHVGQLLDRTSRIAAINSRPARHGQLTTVVVEHSIRSAADVCPLLDETQTYLLLDSAYVAAPPADPLTDELEVVGSFTPDETVLFQFSALAFNSHKIHLDRDYARMVEGYPDLVVNGGLTTLLLTEAARAQHGEGVRRLSVRNRAPLFCNRPVRIARTERGWQTLLYAIDDAGRTAAEMEIETNVV